MKELIDRFGRRHSYLRIAVTDRCNLRCTYCMPPQGIETKRREEILTFSEIVRVSRILARMGITKIRLTGGEPLVRKDVPHLVEQLSRIAGITTLGMTTNGVLLSKFAGQLRSAGLTHINISLDSLRPERFQQITGDDRFFDVIGGIHAAIDAGFPQVKLNIVVMGGINDDELSGFVEFARKRPVGIRFIEYMPFKWNRWASARFVAFGEMRNAVEKQYQLVPVIDPSTRFPVAKEFTIEGFAGSVSFITPLSDHFCGSCDRIRLTADGSMKSCLFHPAEINLKHALRNGRDDETIGTMIHGCINHKLWNHPAVEELAAIENRSMVEIGG